MATNIARQGSASHFPDFSKSPHFDIYNIEPESLTPHLPICTGYLDNTLAIFERHNHPFVLISTLGLRWSGCNPKAQREIDVLVRSPQLEVIVDDLIASGEWKVSSIYANEEMYPEMINHTTVPDVWLKSCIEDPFFGFLRIWPEELYQLSVDCNKIQIPDIIMRGSVLLEEEYDRDPYRRFRPSSLSGESHNLLPRLQIRAKFLRRDIPIFIPTIEEHLNALLDQLREEKTTRLDNGNDPAIHIWNFIRYLYFDWTPNRDWLLDTKILGRNQGLMTFWLDKFKRTPRLLYDPVLETLVSGKMPWELSIRPEFLQPSKYSALNDSQASGTFD